MKIIASLVILTTLSGCAAIDKVSQLWPRDHDPAMVSAYVDLEKNLENAKCSVKETFNDSKVTASWLLSYAEFRKDPQTKALENISNSLKKASESSEAACNRHLNLVRINMKLVKDSWSKR